MSILVGTDFSEHSASALTAAAHLAIRMKQPLHLLHVIELGALEPSEPREATYAETLRMLLDQRAERLRSLGAHVTVHFDRGSPDDALLKTSLEQNVKLVVVAALGKRRDGTWQLGSHADRLAQRSRVPVLVVRNSEPFEAWARGIRPLRIVLGADLSSSAKAAMDWIEALRAFGPCDISAMHLYWPPAELERLGLTGARSYVDPDPTVDEVLQRELGRHLTGSTDASALKLRLEPHMGRIGDRLASLATDEQADLVVVGSHPHTAFSRVWEGSVSHSVLHHAATSVACIPTPESEPKKEQPKLGHVMVVTDFSPVGNTAIALAYATAPRGATLHLVHVTKDPGHFPTEPHDVFLPDGTAGENPRHDAIRRQLAQLIPPHELGGDKITRLHVLESNHVAEAISQAAERIDADMICIGTHGRSGLSKVVLGSVAQAVVAHTHRPVLLARRPRE